MFVWNAKRNIKEGDFKMLDPLKILEEEWKNIQTGVTTSKHDYHSFVLSTIRNSNPDSRTVILRAFDLKGPSIWFNTDKRSKKLFNGLSDKLSYKIVDEETEDVNDEELEEDPDYFNEYDEYDEEDPYSSIKEDFEKEIKKATELIKKNEDVIKDNPNFKNWISSTYNK